MKNENTKKKIKFCIEVLIVVLTAIGSAIMFTNTDTTTGLTDAGLSNLKYFTVLSNLFCGIVYFVDLILYLTVKKNVHFMLKYFVVSAVGLTFAVVAFFLQPLYFGMNLYKDGNLFFHLLVPVTAMIEFMFFEGENGKIPFNNTLIPAVFTLVYGAIYLVNNLINGTGTWPDTNDWYGFLNWGLFVGILIFAAVVLLNWGIACLLRFFYNKQKL